MIKKIIIVFLLVLVSVVFVRMVSFKDYITSKQLEYLNKANEAIEKGVRIKAKVNLEKAMRYGWTTNEEVIYLLSKIYLEEGRINLAKEVFSENFSYDLSKKSYLLYAEILMNESDEKLALKILEQYSNINDKEIKEKIKEIYNSYTILSRSIVEIKYSNKLIAAKEIRWGYLGVDGYWEIDPEYEFVTPFIDDKALVVQNGYGYFINQNGEKLSRSDYKITAAQPFCEKRAAIEVNNKWVYCDKNFNIISKEKEYLSTYANGYAAFNNNGSWGIMDNKGKEILSGYDEILLNRKGQATVSNCFFAKKNRKYKLYDLDGNVLAGPFEFARTFEEKESIAPVKNLKNKWGYINCKGVIVHNFQWNDAISSNSNLAGVKEDNMWGFINKSGELVIDFQFDNVTSFSNGIALLESNITNLVLLNIYKEKTYLFQ